MRRRQVGGQKSEVSSVPSGEAIRVKIGSAGNFFRNRPDEHGRSAADLRPL